MSSEAKAKEKDEKGNKCGGSCCKEGKGEKDCYLSRQKFDILFLSTARPTPTTKKETQSENGRELKVKRVRMARDLECFTQTRV